ncbi:MAG: hypothetical protein R3F65_30490 [bacterium]
MPTVSLRLGAPAGPAQLAELIERVEHERDRVAVRRRLLELRGELAPAADAARELDRRERAEAAWRAA